MGVLRVLQGMVHRFRRGVAIKYARSIRVLVYGVQLARRLRRIPQRGEPPLPQSGCLDGAGHDRSSEQPRQMLQPLDRLDPRSPELLALGDADACVPNVDSLADNCRRSCYTGASPSPPQSRRSPMARKRDAEPEPARIEKTPGLLALSEEPA
jgi:hypothetical protein